MTPLLPFAIWKIMWAELLKYAAFDILLHMYK